MEKNFSGYCRVQDGPRLVFLEEDGGAWEADCNYGGCAYESECPIGRAIPPFLTQQREDAPSCNRKAARGRGLAASGCFQD